MEEVGGSGDHTEGAVVIRQYFINNQPITLPLPTPPSLLLSLSVHDTTTTPGPCSEKSASPREGRGHCAAGVPPCRRRSAVGNQWAGWGSIPVVLSLGWQVTCVSSYVRCPFPSKETRRILERDDPGPPVVQGGQGIGLGSRNLERAGR